MVTSHNNLRRMFIHVLVKFELETEHIEKLKVLLNENLPVSTEYDLL
jgi:hypothetical protein